MEIKTVSKQYPRQETPPLFSKDSTDLGTLHNFAQYSSVSFANSNKRHVSINIQRFKTFIAFFRSSITTDIINTLPPSTALTVFNAYVCRRFLYLLTWQQKNTSFLKIDSTLKIWKDYITMYKTTKLEWTERMLNKYVIGMVQWAASKVILSILYLILFLITNKPPALIQIHFLHIHKDFFGKIDCNHKVSWTIDHGQEC